MRRVALRTGANVQRLVGSDPIRVMGHDGCVQYISAQVSADSAQEKGGSRGPRTAGLSTSLKFLDLTAWGSRNGTLREPIGLRTARRTGRLSGK